MAVTRFFWHKSPLDGFVTTVDPKHVAPIKRRGKLVYGYSFLKAGYRFLKITKKRKLVMLQFDKEQLDALEVITPMLEGGLFADDEVGYSAGNLP